MRKLIFILFLLLLTFTPSFGQGKESELAMMKYVLDVPLDAPVKYVGSDPLPANRPLKVYLAIAGTFPIKQDARVRDKLVEWIAEWNKEEGAKYGMLEIVSDISHADVSLVRFTQDFTEINDLGSDVAAMSQVDPTALETNKSSLNPNYVKKNINAYSYIVVKEPNRLKVLYWRNDVLFRKEIYFSDAMRRKEVESKVHKEMEKEMSKRTTTAKPEKDGKFNGYTLCEELFKLMRAKSNAPQK